MKHPWCDWEDAFSVREGANSEVFLTSDVPLRGLYPESSPSLGPLWSELGRALELMPLPVREAFVEAISKHVSQLPLQSSWAAEWN